MNQGHVFVWIASLLAYDPQRSEQMRQAQRDLIPRYAADTIIEEIARA